MPSIELSAEAQSLLLKVAREAIVHFARNGQRLSIAKDDYPNSLEAHHATFVTLRQDTKLRGCMGTLDACQSLVEDTAERAYAAAFRDPRFSPITCMELENQALDISISVVSPAQEIKFDNEQDLVAKLQPGVDGVILQHGSRRGTFLPSVWDMFAKPETFIEQLKEKTGLEKNVWYDDIRAFRYTTFSIGE